MKIVQLKHPEIVLIWVICIELLLVFTIISVLDTEPASYFRILKKLHTKKHHYYRFVNEKKWYNNCIQLKLQYGKDKLLYSVGDENVKLSILVLSKSTNIRQRCGIRATWSHFRLHNRDYYQKLPFKVNFIVAKDISKNGSDINEMVVTEKKMFNDILYFNNIHESYVNLPHKVIYGLRQAIKIYNHATYILKTDDDCFVNMENIINYITNNHNLSINYMGFVQINMPVIRNKFHRNYVPKSIYPYRFYPPYCSGGGYFIKKSHIPCLLNASNHVKLFRNEDAYMGTLASLCHIDPQNEPRILYGIVNRIHPFNMPPCKLKDQFIIHGIRQYDQIRFNQKITSYKYNNTCK